MDKLILNLTKFITLIFIFFSTTLSGPNPLEEALRKKDYKPKNSVIATKPCDINDTLCQSLFSVFPTKQEEDLLEKRFKSAIHPINIGALKVKKTGKIIEKEVSEDIKKLFLLPKKIKVKSKVEGDKIYTKFIYRFED